MKLKTKSVNLVDLGDWDDLVQGTYGRIYSFQQQDGCKERGSFAFAVPTHTEDYKNDSNPEIINGPERGVSFASWLARDPMQLTSDPEDQNTQCRKLFWERNFYPHVSMIINDLHKKGILDAGEYFIEIDW
jgi:hypothetical protein